MTLLLLTLALVGAAVLAMAAGTILSGRCLRGSCGGADVLGPDGQPLSCESCPLRKRGDTSGIDTPSAARRPVG